MNAGEVYQRYQTLANKAGNGGYAIDMRQSSEGCFYIIKT